VVKEIRQGDVYWLDFGTSSGSGPAERHPCVVVQSDVFNRSRIATTVVCLITSNMDRAAAPGNVALKKGDARLSKPSVVNVSQVVTVDKSELEDRIGRLLSAELEGVLRGLRLVFDGEYPSP
jgi:mRNA interferase MazF